MKKTAILCLFSIVVFACSRKSVASKSEVPAVSAAVLAEGKTIYTQKCGRCHGLKNTGDYTASQWEGIMQQMAPKAKLNETETAHVNAFVKANAKK